MPPAGGGAHAPAGAAFLPVLDRVVAALGREERSVRRSLAVLRASIDEAAAVDDAGG